MNRNFLFKYIINFPTLFSFGKQIRELYIFASEIKKKTKKPI